LLEPVRLPLSSCEGDTGPRGQHLLGEAAMLTPHPDRAPTLDQHSNDGVRHLLFVRGQGRVKGSDVVEHLFGSDQLPVVFVGHGARDACRQPRTFADISAELTPWPDLAEGSTRIDCGLPSGVRLGLLAQYVQAPAKDGRVLGFLEEASSFRLGLILT
jgi:hypothetical protein